MQFPFSWQKYEPILPPGPRDQGLGAEVGLVVQTLEKPQYPKDSDRKGPGQPGTSGRSS